MQRTEVRRAATALTFVAVFGVFSIPSPAGAAEQAPADQAVERAEMDVASLRARTSALPERDRREADKLLREASKRLDGAKTLTQTGNPRLAKRARIETRLAKSRIEDARKLVEGGGSR